MIGLLTPAEYNDCVEHAFRMHGLGRVYMEPKGHIVLDRYQGEFRDGQRSGHGIFTRYNGDRYEGEWRDDRANGSGILTKDDGKVFAGLWTNGCFRQGDRKASIDTTVKECGFE